MKYAAYESYEPSKSVWLDQLPSHWQQLRVKHVIERMESGVSVNSDASPANNEEIGVLKTSCVYGDQFSPQENKRVLEEEIERVACPVKANRLIISRMNTPELVGSCGYVDHDFPNLYLPDRLWQTVFSKSRECSPKFAWYYLTSSPAKSAISSLAAGTSGSMQNIAQDAFVGIGFPLPPVDEQQTIARFLDAKTAQIDALVAQKRQLIDKLKEKRQALIARTVTRGLPPEAAKAAGLEPNPEMKDSGVEWLGAVPAHWGEDKVARLFRAMKGRNAAQLTKEYCATIEGEFPVYSGQTENDGVMSSIDEFEFDAGEDGYLFSTTVGAKAMSLMHLKGEFSLSQNCMVIAPMSDKVQVRFYYYHLQPLFQFERGLIPEHMQASFRMEDLYQYRVAIPPKAEQRAIADYLDQMCAKIDDLLAVTDRAIAQLNEYRQALITSAVTGKIDVRELA